ncbi:MAG: dephospho-CoA kinase [Pyrinomonadaceae bacterium]|jgi:dephospho-CoA kinase|nr:dephospho-CoA kinase [Pyrinomonadaceae bacterium]
MLRAGLTGSIAVGKSFVSSVLAGLGCHVLDADLTAREMVAPGSAGLRAIADAFGLEVLRPDGALDRAKLGAIVFSDEMQRARLNSILHPLIFEAQDAWLRRCEEQDPHGVAVVDAALMIESGGYQRFEKLIVVHCRPELQLERLVKRDGMTAEEAVRRIAAQMPQEKKKKFADYLIDTSGGFDETREQTGVVYEHLKELVAGK